jgi:hypothetical protein
MSYLQNKIAIFFKKRNEIFRKPLEKIINLMLNKCRYINEESLERHNWGTTPIKLKYIPKNINSPSFEMDLLNALDLPDNEKSIIELLWGDIQLGKRVHACIIMWFSVHILKRPVLYIFRNLTIDQQQLQDDIIGTEKYNFNIQFIKSVFEEFNNELQEYFQETNTEYSKDYNLPELKDINSNDMLNKLSNKEAINSNDIFCCLMNHVQLAKINKKFSEYIYYNDELVNISLLVDESDLMAPTSSNDRSNDRTNNDKKDSAACERLLAKMYKKVKYALHITGTAHSLLYNVTTRLSEHTNIQIKISKVHKMKRTEDYFGLFNNSIHFNTALVKPWWEQPNTENHKKTCYDIVEDYDKNIKKIINHILYKRPLLNQILKKQNQKYNSLLISEEKIRANQFSLIDKIINDFPNLFIIIYHGNCLRLYLSKNYEKDIKYWSQWDSNQSTTNQRLWQLGGVYGPAIDTEKNTYLPNNYCYFDINTKILNIKFVYKLLRILFEENDRPILCKTIITITGKYGERGYSFTSDDYDKYSLHLTDQYFVSHSSFNCTDISQRIRIQGKYNDFELKNKMMKLTLWTTSELQDIMQNFYVKFIKEIEQFIMECDNWEDIQNLLESIIDNGVLKFRKYRRNLDTRTNGGNNLQIHKHYDSKNNGYRLILIDDDMKEDDTKISEWCKETNLPEYICINKIKEMNVDEFKKKYGIWHYNYLLDKKEELKEFNSEEEYLNFINDNSIPKSDYKKNKDGFYTTSVAKDKKIYHYEELQKELTNLSPGSNLGITYSGDGLKIGDKRTRLYISYADITNSDSSIFTLRIYTVKTKEKVLPKQTNNYIKKTPYIIHGDKVKYSVFNQDEHFIAADVLPERYYWKTPDGWLYLYDKNRPEIYSFDIISPLAITSEPVLQVSNHPIINNNVLLFTQICFKKAEIPNLRIGIKEIYDKYEIWCKINNKKFFKTKKKFKEELEKLAYKEEESKGVDINNKPGKRGYNINVILI